MTEENKASFEREIKLEQQLADMTKDRNWHKQAYQGLVNGLADTAALQATIAQLQATLTAREARIDEMERRRDSFSVDAASWRGVDEHDVCAECGGAGTKLYGNTSTYHYSAGGQAMTLSVCDKCWGSGNKQKPWRSWKQIDRLAKERDAAVQEAGRLREVLEEIAEMDGYPLAQEDARNALKGA